MRKKKEIKLISLVLPTYLQEKTIEKQIKVLEKVFAKLPVQYELIFVIDGREDVTFNPKLLTNKKIRILGYPKNKGKGFAVRYGMLKAKGDVIGFLDGGAEIDPRGVEVMLYFMNLHDADIVIGSKLHPDSVVSYPIQRKILSWGYRTLIKILFGLSVRDTQVGLKIFRKHVVFDVFPRLAVKRYAFDVETLAVAHYLGYKKIVEAPIKLKFDWGSSIMVKNLWKAVFSMLWDTFAVFYRLKILHYYDKDYVIKRVKINPSFD